MISCVLVLRFYIPPDKTCHFGDDSSQTISWLITEYNICDHASFCIIIFENNDNTFTESSWSELVQKVTKNKQQVADTYSLHYGFTELLKQKENQELSMILVAFCNK